MEVLSEDGEMEGCLAEDGGPVTSQWLAINSTEQLDQFMVSQNFHIIFVECMEKPNIRFPVKVVKHSTLHPQ